MYLMSPVLSDESFRLNSCGIQGVKRQEIIGYEIAIYWSKSLGAFPTYQVYN